MSVSRVMVIGLDGGSLTLLEPLAENGVMPNLREVFRRGCYGTLRSTLPPFSAPAWVSFGSGKNPGKHGIFGFYRKSLGSFDRVPIDSSWVAARMLWDVLSQHGLESCVINIPISYPPKPLKGVLVSDFLVTPRRDCEFTYPPELKGELLDRVEGYHPAPFRAAAQSGEFLDEVLRWTERHEAANRYILRTYPWSFFVNNFQASDIVQHYFWDHLRPDRLLSGQGPFSRKLLEVYRLLDRIIGERLGLADKGTTVLLMSDHGFTDLRKFVYVNRWLRDQGLLVLNPKNLVQRSLEGAGVSQREIVRAIRRMDIFGLTDRMPLRRKWRLGTRLDQFIGGGVNWGRTRAYSGDLYEEGVYINLSGREPFGIVREGAEYEEVRGLIRAGLAGLTEEATGALVFNRIYRREEIYWGPLVDRAPDLVFDMGDGYAIHNKISVRHLFEAVPRTGVTGRHHVNGFYAWFGKGVEGEGKVEDGSILDVAPTVLYLLGVPIPRGMDGRILSQVVGASRLSAAPPTYSDDQDGGGEGGTEVFTTEDAQAIRERLSGLGYLG